MVVLFALALLAGVLTRALGVGYSLVLAPAAAALLPAGEAVCLVLATGVLLNAGLLAQGRRAGERGLGGPGLGALVAGAVAGQVVVALTVGALDSAALRIVAGVALLGGCALTVVRRPAALAPARVLTGVPAGALIGAAGFLTGITGPFAAVWLAARSPGGEALRRCLYLAVAVLSATGLALQATVGAGGQVALDAAGGAVLLAPALAVGVVLGGPGAARLHGARHRLAIAGVAALGAVLLLAR